MEKSRWVNRFLALRTILIRKLFVFVAVGAYSVTTLRITGYCNACNSWHILHICLSLAIVKIKIGKCLNFFIKGGMGYENRGAA